MANPLVSSSIFLCHFLASGLQSPSLMAQNEKQASSASNQQEPQTQIQPPSEEHEAIIVPAPLGGFNPRLTAEPETQQRPSLLTGSIGVIGLYTDNAFTSDSNVVDDYQYSILPSLGFQTFGPHTQWTLSYGGGITVDQRAPGNFQQAHDATVDVRHDFTRHLSAEARQDYTMSNSPFAQIGASASLPTAGGPGQLSPFAVPQPVTRIGSISTANLMYQFRRYSAMGVSGSFSLLNFRDDARLAGTSGNLIDTTNAAGRAFYLRQISQHHTIGTEYQLQGLRFNDGVARTVDQTLYLFDGISFKGNMTLSLYAGPELTHTHNAIIARPNLPPMVLPVVGDVWSVAGGIAYAWQGRSNGLRISGDRRVSDGSGWSGAVRLNTASLEVERVLSERWTATLVLAYSDGRTIGVPSNSDAGRIITEEGLVGFLYQITRDLSVTAQGGRIQQPHAALFTQTLNPDHNLTQIGLVYKFQKALSQ